MDELIKNPIIVTWLKDYSQRKKLYEKHKQAMSIFVKANPDLNIDSYTIDTRMLRGKKLIEKQDQITQAILNTVKYLEENQYGGTSFKNYISSILKFHKLHNMELPPDIKEKIKEKQIHKGKEFYTTAPKREQIQAMLSHANILDKAIMLTAIAIGKRPSEVLNIDEDELHLNENPPRIATDTRNAGNKNRTPYGFITEECKIAINNYLPQRTNFLQRRISYQNHHFPGTNKKLNAKKANEEILRSTKLFPIEYGIFLAHWHKYLNKAGLHETRKNGHQEREKITPKSLRYYFRTNLGNPDLAEHLMGHTDMHNTYYGKQEDEIAKDYLKYATNLYIDIFPSLEENKNNEMKRQTKENIIDKGRLEVLTEKLKQLEPKAIEHDKLIKEIQNQVQFVNNTMKEITEMFYDYAIQKDIKPHQITTKEYIKLLKVKWAEINTPEKSKEYKKVKQQYKKEKQEQEIQRSNQTNKEFDKYKKLKQYTIENSRNKHSRKRQAR